MPANKFRFVSPGIFLNEIDQSQIPAEVDAVGPVIIGRAEKGPGMIPTKVRSFSDFVETFGNPLAGKGAGSDVWREGNYAAPTYAAYAAQAYLRSGVGPVTFMRLMGTQHVSANTAGYAGWETTNDPSTNSIENGGPYGLFVFPSGASGATYEGTLAGVFYINTGSTPVLSGTCARLLGSERAEYTDEGVALVIRSDSSGLFKMRILQGNRDSATEIENQTFSLAESNDRFVRRVFNTNPQLTNTTIEGSSNDTPYWLGETFERYLNDKQLDTATVRYGFLAPVASGSNQYGNHERRMAYRDAHTGWFFGQHLSADTASYDYTNVEKLFKFIGINGHGEWLQNNVKISIDNIRASSNENLPFGTFDVVIRSARDSDLRTVVLERFSNCDLNPNSPNYIAVKIGDTSEDWDSVEKRHREFGTYPNVSRYVRVVMAQTFDAGSPDEALLPFGVFGPPRFPTFTATSGASEIPNAYILGSGNVPNDPVFGYMSTFKHTSAEDHLSVGQFISTQAHFGTASIVFPAVGTRASASTALTTTTTDGAHPTTNAYFGVHTGKTATSTTHDPGYGDYLKAFSHNIVADGDWGDTFGYGSLPGGLEYQWVFSLDEIVLLTGSNFSDANPSGDVTTAIWHSGSYNGTSLALHGAAWNAAGSGGGTLTAGRYKNILDSKVNRFTSPLFGGFDGMDITERDPFRNSLISSNPTEQNSYVYYTLRRAVDTVADPEVIEMNALVLPGITDDRITKHVIDTAENRADALAIIDIEGGFTPRHEENATRSSRKGNLSTVLTNIKARNLNSSYGCAYYPWVKIRDDLNGTFLEVPPSVVALGVLANTERAADVWFAPAGFRRGGLSFGAGGLPVVGIETKLTSRNRDDLYDVNINPIASFPAEGIVVFGQKTLQATRSALDRINVRRLMIFVKRGISRISATTLFQPNVTATWNDFKSKTDKFLNDVKIRFGVDDFRVILDETTTTTDLIDRNIMYAKIFIKPTRAIEFIAIDFIITRSGASFED